MLSETLTVLQRNFCPPKKAFPGDPPATTTINRTPPGALAYATAKDSLVTFTKFHAEEVRDSNICVVIISPGAAIATEDAPEEARNRMPGPDYAGPRFVLCAQAGMEMSGKLLDFQDGELVVGE